jgi:hypothetical protein
MRELATDEMVVRRLGGDGKSYAMELVLLAQEASKGGVRNSAGLLTAAAMAGENTSALERRVRSLLSKSGARGKAGLFGSLALSALLILAVVALSCCVPSRSVKVWTEDEVRMRLSADPFPG